MYVSQFWTYVLERGFFVCSLQANQFTGGCLWLTINQPSVLIEAWLPFFSHKITLKQQRLL